VTKTGEDEVVSVSRVAALPGGLRFRLSAAAAAAIAQGRNTDPLHHLNVLCTSVDCPNSTFQF